MCGREETIYLVGMKEEIASVGLLLRDIVLAEI